MKTWKKVLALLLAVCLCASFVACSTGDSGKTPTDSGSSTTTAQPTAAPTATNKTVITFWHSMTGTNGEALNKMIDTFNASQNEVQVVGVFQGDYYTGIANAITAIATGSGPDLMQTGSMQVNLLSDEDGVVANWLDYLNKDGIKYDDFYEGFISYYLSADGKYLPALPMGCSTPVLYSNKTMLDKAGVTVPTTWDEMQAACAKLVDGGSASYGFAQPRDSWYFWMMIPNYTGTPIFSADGLKLDCRDAGIKSFEFLQNMVKSNYFFPAPAQDGATVALQMFQESKLAFWINSIGGLKGAENAATNGGWELQVSSVPGKSVPSGGNSLVMMESSKNKDAVWKFIQWLYTSEDGIAYFDSQSGYLACTKTIKDSEVIKAKMSSDANYAVAYDFIANVNNKHIVTGVSGLSTDIMSFMDAVFYDKEDVTAQWDILEPAVNQILADAHAK